MVFQDIIFRQKWVLPETFKAGFRRDIEQNNSKEKRNAKCFLFSFSFFKERFLFRHLRIEYIGKVKIRLSKKKRGKVWGMMQ